MAQNPSPSQLDTGQIVKRAFDEVNDRLRVDIQSTVSVEGQQEIAISHTDDSIKIGDGTDLLAIDADGSAQVRITSSALPAGAALESTLTNLNNKVTAVNTGAVVVSSSVLPSGAATGAKQDTGNTSLSSLDTKIEAPTSAIIDEASASVNYFGFATPGAATNSSSWRIKKLLISGNVTSVLYADGNSNYDNVWDNRAAYSYS